MRKLNAYKEYFNRARVHSGIDGKTPKNRDSHERLTMEPGNLKWKTYCQGLFNVPLAA
jgi:hypothetical protein